MTLAGVGVTHLLMNEYPIRRKKCLIPLTPAGHLFEVVTATFCDDARSSLEVRIQLKA